jgi:predicted RNase H-like nuclease (RuvC/YqgF family)
VIIIRGDYDLVECPKCRTEVITPVKTWSIPSRKAAKSGEEREVVMGIFECPSCKARFRAAVTAETKAEETVSVKNMVERIKGIKGELMQTLKNLRGKIKTLETERANLMIEIEKLKKMAESKVGALEGEVSMLREEVKSLRDLLGYTEEPEK